MSGTTGRRDDVGEPEKEGAPTDLYQDTAQTRALVRALDHAMRDFRNDLTEINNRAHADFFRLLCIFGAGFVLLASMFIIGYLRLDDRIEDKFGKIEERLILQGTAIEHTSTQLDDLLARIPPVSAAPQHR